MTVVLVVIGLAIALAVIMAIAWLVVLLTLKSGWTDAFWSAGIGIVGTAAALLPLGPDEPSTRARIVAALVALWSFRLAVHIGRRTLSGGDDPRYAKLREEWGDHYRSQLFVFLQIQAAAALVLALAVLAAAHNPAPLGVFDLLGVAISLGAIAGEAVSDRQLRAFAADPAHKGKVCDVGLWSLSRHPNYFFEWLYWLGFVFIGISLPGYGWGLATLAAPALMYWLLVHVSGIPLLEAHMLRSRGDAFRVYQARVRAFWPLPRLSGT